mmetsp:Transcript_10366/g.22265  ORF Transcript_10366/g.22265 Transcript_10366/m.22265 type:complete len:440 (-) Transcript_10366:997-2316(-)
MPSPVPRSLRGFYRCLPIACCVWTALWVLSRTETRLAVIGDFGSDAIGGGHNEARAAALVEDLNSAYRLDGILALGDTNYPVGSATTMDVNVGKYYGKFIWPLTSSFSNGAPDKQNRFFPCPGNHDWGNRLHGGSLAAYLQYMPVAGRYFYDVVINDVHIFSLDSDPNQERLNGTTATSPQAQWLQAGLAASTAPWRLVFFHHPPFSSGVHGSNPNMQWPFEEWGAHAVLSGHDHHYERVMQGPRDFPYFVNGLGGGMLYGTSAEEVEGSVVRYTGTPGAQLVEANTSHIRFRLVAAVPGYPVADCWQMRRDLDGSTISEACPPDMPPPILDTRHHISSPGLLGSNSSAVMCLGMRSRCVGQQGTTCCAQLVCHSDGRCGPPTNTAAASHHMLRLQQRMHSHSHSHSHAQQQLTAPASDQQQQRRRHRLFLHTALRGLS